MNQQFLKDKVVFLQKLVEDHLTFWKFCTVWKNNFLKQLFNIHQTLNILNLKVKSVFCHMKVQTNWDYILLFVLLPGPSSKWNCGKFKKQIVAVSSLSCMRWDKHIQGTRDNYTRHAQFIELQPQIHHTSANGKVLFTKSSCTIEKHKKLLTT